MLPRFVDYPIDPVTTTMLQTPFLTDLDSRAAVKGSRDPLGIQQIWTRLGRAVVGNLTTVSSSVRDFTTLLVGYYFTERLAEKLGSGSELNVFLKWEQLAAYAVPTLIAITCSVEPRRFERICPKVLASRFPPIVHFRSSVTRRSMDFGVCIRCRLARLD